MARQFDVAARLAEAREAVQHTETYVAACRIRGYQHPDLTAHGAQVQDWYDGDDGMDLRLLDGDCTGLWTLANAAEEALRVQRTQLGELEAVWRGPGCDAAARFLRGHCETAVVLVERLRAAADACGTLRDELWRLVDGKVATAVGIDDRACAPRAEWLAAAHAVTAGTGDSEMADSVIDNQVKPYVDNDIRADWVAAMRSERASVTAAYETAAAAATPAGVVFPVPGDLGPRYAPDEPVTPAWPAAVVPSGGARPSGSTADLPGDRYPADPEPPPAAGPSDPPAGDLADWPTDAGFPGGGLPGGFDLPAGTGGPGGLAGVIPRIADAIGNLLGSPDGGPDEPVPDEPLDADEVADDEPPDDAEPGEAEPVADEADETPVTEAADDAPAADAAADVPGGGAGADQAAAAPPPDAPAQQADSGGKTPCEIAADELPQVGP